MVADAGYKFNKLPPRKLPGMRQAGCRDSQDGAGGVLVMLTGDHHVILRHLMHTGGSALSILFS